MKTIALFMSTICLAFGASVIAGEFGGGNAGNAVTAEAVADAVGHDAGAEAVYQAQVNPGVHYEANRTAQDQLGEYAQAKGFFDGWDEARKRYFVTQAEAFNLEDPRTDRNFLIKREMLAKQAVLRAKADIIRFINSEMSAMDQIDVPGTDLYNELNAEYEAIRGSIESQQRMLARLLERIDAAEAKALAGASFDDRVNALVEAAVKRLDGEFNAGNIEAAQRERYETAKQRYNEAMAEYENLRKRAESLKGKVTGSFASSMAVQARMPLMGAAVIQQAESWDSDSNQYQVAVLLCWSAELEKAARAALSGDTAPPDGKSGNQSINDWLNNQDLGVMVGPRQFLDDRGQRHFIGITSRPAARDANLDRNNRSIADLFAAQMAVFSLFADVDTYQEARQLAQTRSSGDLETLSDTAVAETLTERMTQKFERMKVQGLGPLLRKRVRHAITGQDMHVSVYGINPAAAVTAMKLERQAALSAIAFNQDQVFRAARSKALSDAVVEAGNDSAARRAGALTGRAEIEAAKQAAAKSGAPAASAAPAARTAPAGRTASGSAMGDDVQDDF